jgi:septal ring-binding cell division protein DamX
MTVQEAPTGSPPETESACPTCGASAERGQLVCLECGSRIALTYRRPPSWRLPVAILSAVLAAAIVASVIGLGAITNDAEQEVASKPAGKTGSPKGKKSEPGKGEKRASAKGETKGTKGKAKKSKARKRPKASKPAIGAGGVQRWPRGRAAFTVVILSAEDPVSARKFARSAAKRGTDVGVLRTDSYRSLPKGFWVVFSGVYRTRRQADRAAGRLGRRYSGAFPQLVKR